MGAMYGRKLEAFFRNWTRLEDLIFFTSLILFEYLLVLVDPYIEGWGWSNRDKAAV